MDLVLQQIVNGLTMGAIYAIVGLGYTMVYGIIRLINFAHGAVFMVGAYVGLSILEVLGGAHPSIGIAPALLLALVIPAVVCGGLWASRWILLVYRKLRAMRAHPLIPSDRRCCRTSILETSSMLIWGKEFKVYPAILPVWHVTIGGAVLNSQQYHAAW